MLTQPPKNILPVAESSDKAGSYADTILCKCFIDFNQLFILTPSIMNL